MRVSALKGNVFLFISTIDGAKYLIHVYGDWMHLEISSRQFMFVWDISISVPYLDLGILEAP
jgi:hypothetical protein